MKLSGKIILLATGSAVLGSAVTTVAMKHALLSDNVVDVTTYTVDNSASNGLFKVSQTPVQSTDFTEAAESTINGVVSIKSYATPRGLSLIHI